MEQSNQQWSAIMTLVAVIIILMAILSIYRFQVEKSPISEDPNENLEKKQKKEEFSQKNILALMITVLVAILVSIYYISKGETGALGEKNNDSLVAFIPIWTAIFLPVLVKKKHFSTGISSEHKRLLFVILSVVILVGLSLLAWVYFYK